MLLLCAGLTFRLNLEITVKIGNRCGLHMLLSVGHMFCCSFQRPGVHPTPAVLRFADRAPGGYLVFTGLCWRWVPCVYRAVLKMGTLYLQCCAVLKMGTLCLQGCAVLKMGTLCLQGCAVLKMGILCLQGCAVLKMGTLFLQGCAEVAFLLAWGLVRWSHVSIAYWTICFRWFTGCVAQRTAAVKPRLPLSLQQKA